jgi:hypothetical protein
VQPQKTRDAKKARIRRAKITKSDSAARAIAFSAESSLAPAEPASVSPRGIYQRIVALIQSRPHTPRVRGPFDRLLIDLGFTKPSLRNFADDVTAAFQDLRVIISRDEILECNYVIDLCDLVLTKAGSL